MKPASISQIKKELKFQSQEDTMNLCLKLARFKKENKELLSYLLFEEYNEPGYINDIKEEIDEEFININRNSYHYIKKSVRKIQKKIKKYIKFSKKKETEVELLIYFCKKLRSMKPSIDNNVALFNIFYKQKESIKKTIKTLHEDLQYDYDIEMEDLD
jgi:hypothetical protein